jgi:hypothetical protein
MICGGHRGAAFILWPRPTAPQHLTRGTRTHTSAIASDATEKTQEAADRHGRPLIINLIAQLIAPEEGAAARED